MVDTPRKPEPKKTALAKKAATAKAPSSEKTQKNAISSPAREPAEASKPETPAAPAAKAAAPAPEPKEATAAEPATKAVEAAPKMAEAVAEEAKSAEEAAPEPVKNEPETFIPTPAAAEEGTIIMTEAIETTKKVAVEANEKFQAMFGDFNERAKAAAERSGKLVEEMNDLTKGNVEALVESGKIAAKGAETLGQEAAEYSRRSFEKATSTMKSFASVKSPTEFFQLQSEFLSSTFDSLATEASKNSEAMLKLANDVVQPISSRVAVVSEKVKSFAA